MRFVWYWTFWHWSKESSRAGFLLRSPLQGVGGHWDEWFRHEASENDLRIIEEIGRSETDQRRFIAWLLVHWAREAGLPKNRQALRFVLGQLAQVQPFNRWTAFDKYRASYGSRGISAIVLAQGSAGEPQDVRLMEALALPFDPTAPAIVAEGFQADSIDLETPRRAAADILGGRGLVILIASWLVGGKRPYPQWLKIALASGWLAVGGLILYLAEGPEPGGSLFLLSAILAGLWGALALVAILSGGSLAVRAWREGKRLRAQLEQSQVRLRMDGGLTLRGGSAGAAFCLNTLLALYRSDTRAAYRSWLWQRLFRNLNGEAGAWAATGVITTDGSLKSVVLEPKLSACLQRDRIKHLLTPRQAGAGRQVVERLAGSLNSSRRKTAGSSLPASGGVRLGFAAEEEFLRIHPYRHVTQALMRLGGLASRTQLALNIFAVAISILMVLAASDLKDILLPPPAPLVVGPSAPVPNYLWVSLNTKHPEDYLVVLESEYWSNRRATVTPHSGASGSMRAEIQLHRSPAPGNEDREDGVVWIERRHWFLTREFAPGERVGRYELSFLNRIGHE